MTSTEKIIESLAQDAAIVKPAPHPFALSAKWLAGIVAYLALTLVYSGLRHDLMVQFQSTLFDAELLLLTAVIVSACLSAALLAFPDLHQKQFIVWTPVLMLALFALVMTFSWINNTHPTHLSGHSVECLIFISFLTLLPAAWIFYSIRKLASTHPYQAGSIALLAAFSIGALSLRLSEPTNSIEHVLQWHYLPMIAAGLIGIGLGKIWLKW